MNFFIYMVRCSDETLYTGYTTDLQTRIKQHNSNSRGAKYTKMRRPVKLVYIERCKTRREAMKREKEIKQFSRDKKIELVKSFRKEQLASIVLEDHFED